MNTEDSTSFVLRYGSLAGVALVAAGLVLYLLGLSFHIWMITAGIAAIVFTPFAGMAVSFISLSLGRERSYAASALVLIMITVIGMLAAFCL